jgi:endonuclease G
VQRLIPIDEQITDISLRFRGIQRWQRLENYFLSHARADGMRVTVFTGPIFSDTDMDYRDAKIPKAFWKVVAIVTETGRPSATAYKVSQEKELEELEFVYAGYKTYQISW